MTDFTPTPETVEAVARKLDSAHDDYREEALKAADRSLARAAIAAFVEAEGLRLEGRRTGGLDYRLVGSWRKR